jgi:hypothetical protein
MWPLIATLLAVWAASSVFLSVVVARTTRLRDARF